MKKSSSIILRGAYLKYVTGLEGEGTEHGIVYAGIILDTMGFANGRVYGDVLDCYQTRRTFDMPLEAFNELPLVEDVFDTFEDVTDEVSVA